VLGSDIDGRQMRGKGQKCYGPIRIVFTCPLYDSTGKPPGIIRAATQYGVAERIVDLCTFDVTHNPWRCGGLFDAIVTDPPCEHTHNLSLLCHGFEKMASEQGQSVWVGRRSEKTHCLKARRRVRGLLFLTMRFPSELSP
jgi:hypothetical protein